MADTKVSLMTALTGAGVATSDIMPIIDVSATTAGSKSITMAELYNYLATVLQPLDSDLTSIAALTTTSYGRAFLALADAAAARTAIGTVIGTDVQAYAADLSTIAGLTATTDNFIQSKSSAWASRTPTQVTADLIAMVGDSGAGGTKGLVPAPAAGDAAASKFLKADGTWATAGGVSDPLTLTSILTITQDTANEGIIASTGYSLTGTNATSMLSLTGTLNTTGTPDVLQLNITNTASNSASNLFNFKVGGSTVAAIDIAGRMRTVNYRFLSSPGAIRSSDDTIAIQCENSGVIKTNGETTIRFQTATPAGGSTSARLLFGTTSGFGIYYGSGAPTVSAAQGSIYLRSDGSGTADRLYVNTNGSTTWTNFTSAA